MSRNDVRAFTLAEVLVTLGIIGVVAALTLPTLIANYQKQQYVTGLKKAYSTWNQALQQMALDSGCPNDLSCFFDSSNRDIMSPKIANYFKPIKFCGLYEGLCFPDRVAVNYDGTSVETVWSTNSYTFVSADGMSVRLYTSPSQGCQIDSGTSNSFRKICMYNVYVDINGLSQPNTVGRDIFMFSIVNDKTPLLYPFGGTRHLYWQLYNQCNFGVNGGNNKSGNFCAGRIMDEGWQMNY